MDTFFSTYVWPTLIMVAQSLLLMVALLIYVRAAGKEGNGHG